ncbi:MAG: LapA family protein [Actinomycetota bacterium]|nr:LapA family protein [Actinomycetota bacterium]
MNGEPQQRPADRNAHLARLILIGIVVGLLVAFILGNSEQVRVSFVFFHSRFSLIWVLLVTNLLGFVAGYLLHGRLGARGSRGKH